jgi:hypothetical protein
VPLPRNHNSKRPPPSSYRAQLSFAIEPRLQTRILELARAQKVSAKRLVLGVLRQVYPALDISDRSQKAKPRSALQRTPAKDPQAKPDKCIVEETWRTPAWHSHVCVNGWPYTLLHLSHQTASRKK